MQGDMCIIVDENDMTQGVASKLMCHRLGHKQAHELPLHRAFSLFLFNEDGNRLLLQKRAPSKLTFPNLWTNTCCSHPLMTGNREESIVEAARRKTLHELGLSISKATLLPHGRVLYHAPSPPDYGEHERTA